VHSGDGVDFESGDAGSFEAGVFVVGNGKPEVIVEINLLIVGKLETNGVSTKGKIQVMTLEKDGQRIELQVDTVLTFHELSEPLEFLGSNVGLSKDSTGHVLFHLNIKGSRLEVVSQKTGTQITAQTLFLEPTSFGFLVVSGKIVDIKGNGSQTGFDQIGVNPDLFVPCVILGRDTREKDLGKTGFLLAEDATSLVTETIFSKEFRLFGIGNFVHPLLSKILVGL